MIWQDFMFACSMYPAEGALLDNIHQEAVDNVKRLRNHACIALWCGNNECQDAWLGVGLEVRDRNGRIRNMPTSSLGTVPAAVSCHLTRGGQGVCTRNLLLAFFSVRIRGRDVRYY